jgi:NADPH:quinone reductase
MVINLGRHDGFKTLNVVRRREAADELRKLGADAAVSSSDGPIDDQVRSITDGKGVRYAIDPVGGQTGSEVFRSLAPEGRLVLYGTLSGEPIQVDPRSVISEQRVVEGFYLGHWMRARSVPAALLLFREISALFRQGVFRSPVSATYPLTQIKDAVQSADTVGRAGKVLLKL